MYFENLTGYNEIGSHCFSLKMGSTRIVLDAGVHPKREGFASLPNFEKLTKGSVDAICISHAHLDHLGALPVLMEKQPDAEVFMTHATLAIGDAMMHNSVNVMSSKRVEEGIVEYPLFNHGELEDCVERWIGCHFGQTFTVGSKNDVDITFYSAGHILGAAGILVEYQGHRLLYTGDVNFEDQTLTPAADLPTENIDTLLLECTRGSVPRREGYTRESEEARFAQAVQDSLDRGGIVLVPVFALGKTQEILTMIHRQKQKGVISRSAPVYIGGLSTKVTRIFDKFADSTPRLYPNFRIMDEVDVTVAGKRSQKKALTCHAGGIYVLSSGMMTEKTLSNRIATQILPHPANTILFVGYADPDSPAGAIKIAKQGEVITLDKKVKVPLKCRIEEFDFSGHADREQLVNFAKKVSPKNLFLVHGDQDALDWMYETCKKALPHSHVQIANHDETYKLP